VFAADAGPMEIEHFPAQEVVTLSEVEVQSGGITLITRPSASYCVVVVPSVDSREEWRGLLTVLH